MKHIQQKAMLVMLAVLHFTEFSQSGLHAVITDFNKNEQQKRPVSLAYVNIVIRDLGSKGFVEHTTKNISHPFTSKRKTEGQIRYHLANPIGLLQYIALFRRMNELNKFRLQVDADEDVIIEHLRSKGAIFCLGTAQSSYSSYFRPDGIDFYHSRPEELLSDLKTARPGKRILRCYNLDFDPQNGFSVDQARGTSTSRVQTVVDMFCDNSGVYTKSLLKELWGIEI